MIAQKPHIETEEGLLHLIEDLEAHTKTPRQCARERRQELKDQPERSFSDLEEGRTYVTMKRRSGRLRSGLFKGAIIVERITPKGKQAVVRRLKREDKKRVYEGKERSTTFLDVTSKVLGSLGYEHQDVVEKALGMGYEIPPAVRRHYPQLFVDVPEEFEEVGEKTLKGRLTGGMYNNPASVERLHRWYENVREEMQKHLAYKAEAKADSERRRVHGTCVETGDKLLRMYGWMLKHVGEGKTFGSVGEAETL